MTKLNLSCRIDSLNLFYDFYATVDVLRLDLVGPVISGNKWFKLQIYLNEAMEQNRTVLTFGGAYSNHLVATAAAAKMARLKSIGVVRGEKAAVLSHTLTEAVKFGMELHFTSREAYKIKTIPESVQGKYEADELYIIPEGGYGIKGATGTEDILRKNTTAGYTHVFSAVGSGTTLAGLVAAANENQKVIGVSVFKNNNTLISEINNLLPPHKHGSFKLIHDYHFGGYAKHTPVLIEFMNRFYQMSAIPTDFIYTAKAFYAAFDMMQKGYFSPIDKLLLIHTGGLQGNRSLPKGTLIFG